MKKLGLLFIVIFVSGAISGHDEKNSPIPETGTLLVLVTGFKSTEGQLMVALYDNATDFPDKEPFKGSITEISANKELIKFENIPRGDYAVAVLHDINKDGKLDKNFFGIPTEGYGFSNNAIDKYGPPSFLQASFVYFGRDDAKAIDLEYGIPK
jgi:uncharacterized protein (DUF2141 family)